MCCGDSCIVPQTRLFTGCDFFAVNALFGSLFVCSPFRCWFIHTFIHSFIHSFVFQPCVSFVWNLYSFQMNFKQQGGFLSRVLCNSVLGDHFIGSSSSGVHPLYGMFSLSYNLIFNVNDRYYNNKKSIHMKMGHWLVTEKTDEKRRQETININRYNIISTTW